MNDVTVRIVDSDIPEGSIADLEEIKTVAEKRETIRGESTDNLIKRELRRTHPNWKNDGINNVVSMVEIVGRSQLSDFVEIVRIRIKPNSYPTIPLTVMNNMIDDYTKKFNDYNIAEKAAIKYKLSTINESLIGKYWNSLTPSLRENIFKQNFTVWSNTPPSFKDIRGFLLIGLSPFEAIKQDIINIKATYPFLLKGTYKPTPITEITESAEIADNDEHCHILFGNNHSKKK